VPVTYFNTGTGTGEEKKMMMKKDSIDVKIFPTRKSGDKYRYCGLLEAYTC